MADTYIFGKISRALKRPVLRILPPCKEIAQVISASFDRDLTIRERFVLRLHLFACKPCERYLEQSTFLRDATSRLDEKLKDDLISGQLNLEARERIKSLLKSSAGLIAIYFVS